MNYSNILTHEDVLQEINSTCATIQCILNLRNGSSRILLQVFNWDETTLLRNFSTYTNSYLFLHYYGLAQHKFVENRKAKCPICCSNETLIHFECGHVACANCWASHLRQQIENGKSLIRCLNCELIVDPERLPCDSTLLTSYRTQLVRDYVRTIPRITFCPGNNCDKVIRITFDKQKPAVCSCGARFCTMCHQNAHMPATCRQAQPFIKESMEHIPEERESYDWIGSNTKNCPKCWTPIQKSGGCAHMRCEMRKCQFEFCWNCMGDWRTSTHDCVSTEPARLTASEPRFQVHLENYKTQKLHLESEKNFFAETKTLLIECRQVLMNSHVFSFYLNDGKFSKVLEENRRRLEVATQALSDVTRTTLGSYQSEVVDAEKHLKVLLDHCRNRHSFEKKASNKRRRFCIIFSILLLILILLILSGLFFYFFF